LSISRHTIYNLLGTILPLAISLLTTPVYLGVIGEERYGVLAIVWLLLGYFGLFDFGLGQATAQSIASLRDRSADERAEAFGTALTLNTAFGVVGGLLILPIASYFFGHFLHIAQDLRVEILAAIPWLAVAVPLATLSGVMVGALQGRERFLEINVVSVISAVLFQMLPLLTACFVSTSLGALLPAVLVARLIATSMLFKGCQKHVATGYLPKFAVDRAGKLLRFGGWVTVSAFISPLMSIVDRFVIGALGDAKAVTHYTVPLQLAERSTIASVALTSAIYPRLCAASPEEERRLLANGLWTLAVVMTLVVCAGIFLIKPFLSWWISPEFSEHTSAVGQIILAGMWCNGIARLPFLQLNARGRPDITAKCHVAEVVPYFAAVYVGVKVFGVNGAAAAFSLRVMVDMILLIGIAGIFRLALSILAIPLVLTCLAFITSLDRSLPADVYWALAGAQVLAIACWSWWVVKSKLKMEFPIVLMNMWATATRRGL
jgi:O-antigen/teichoic acid export membrane protein